MTKSWVVHYDNKLAAQAKNFAYAKNISAMKEFKFMNAIKIYMIIYYECRGALPDFWNFIIYEVTCTSPMTVGHPSDMSGVSWESSCLF